VKDFEYHSAFDKVSDESIVASFYSQWATAQFLWHPVVIGGY